jgi:hypothetical protein
LYEIEDWSIRLDFWKRKKKKKRKEVGKKSI